MCNIKFSRHCLAVFASLSVIFLSACSSDGEERPEYMDASSVKGLEIPPKLTSPDTSGALRLPEPSEKARKAFENNQENNTAIAPRFKGLELKNSGQLYWLEIDKPVADVWAMLPDFLASEGIKISRVERLMGFVDTEWMNEFEVSYASQSGVSSWFSALSPDYKDKFRIRLEADKDINKTRFYVSHRGLQIVVANDVTEWAQRDSEAFLEREIMYRFTLYAGASKQAGVDLLAGYSSYQPRSNADKDNISVIEVLGDQETVWLRLKIAIDRLGVEVVKSDAANGSLQVVVGSLKVTPENKDTEESWFSGLFGGGDVDVGDDETYDTPEYKAQTVVEEGDEVTVNVQQLASEFSSQIKLSYLDGSNVEEGHGRNFRDALLRQLR